METDPANPPSGNPPAAQSTQPPAPASIVNPDGTFAENWTNNLGDELKSEVPTLSRFKNVKDLSKSYIDARKKLGRNPEDLIVIPKDDSSDEVKAAFYKARGWPDSPDKYEYELSKEMKERLGSDVDPKLMTDVRKFAHEKLHLNQSEFKEMLDYYHNFMAGQADKGNGELDEFVEQRRLDGVVILKKEFGVGLNERTLRAEGLMDKYGSKVIKDADGTEKTLIQKLEEEIPAIKTSPYMRMIFDAVAETLSEDTLKGVGRITTPTTTDIDSKIAELRQHPAYMDNKHPDFQRIQDQITALYKQKHPA